MQRYRFNIHDGVSQLDHVGTESPSLKDAQLAAIRLAGAVLLDEAKRVRSCRDWHLDVLDDAGHVQFRLDFSIKNAITLSNAKPARDAF